MAEADVLQCPFYPRLCILEPVDRQRFRQHPVDGVARVDRAVGVLKHHLHLTVERRITGSLQGFATDTHGPARGRGQTANRAQHGRFSRPALADQTETLVLRHVETDTAHGLHPLTAGPEGDSQIADFNK